MKMILRTTKVIGTSDKQKFITRLEKKGGIKSGIKSGFILVQMW